MLLPWPQYYKLNKDTMSMNEMLRQYNLMIELEDMADNSTNVDRLGRPLGFLLQENLDYLLQEDGSRIYWN